MNSSGQQSFYQIEGGSLPLTAKTYVGREADEQLYRFAQSGEGRSRVCFVLAPRQTGKSSLMVRTAKRLSDAGSVCAQINLQGLGDVQTEKSLWFSLLYLICEQVAIPDSNLVERLNAVWDEQPYLASSLRFKNFLVREIIPKLEEQKLIIFLDEIQTLIKWNQDSFIGFIKALSESREGGALHRLAFVLLGVAKPSDFLTSPIYALNLGEWIELGNLTGDCQPLWQGLAGVTSDPGTVLDLILYWTGGQPFLTQLVCHLVASGSKIGDESDPAAYIEKLVTKQVIENWRRQERQSHLQEIENWWTAGAETSIRQQKLAALRVYRKVLGQGSVKFNRAIMAQWDLLISGLVAKEEGEEGLLRTANPIYERVFTLKWTQKTEDFIEEYIMVEALNNIKSRAVFMLVDQSGSMVKRDGCKISRWKLLEEKITGDVGNILDAGVCDKIALVTFNRNMFNGMLKRISEPDQVEDIFLENTPGFNSFVVPTFRKCLELWLDGREKVTAEEVEAGKVKGAFFIIYTDGQFDDTDPGFEDLIKEVCSRIDDQRIVKVLIIGIGQGVNAQYFDELDINSKKNKDLNGKDCNIVVFDLEGGLDYGILELMQRQMKDTSQVRKGFSKPELLENSGQ